LAGEGVEKLLASVGWFDYSPRFDQIADLPVREAFSLLQLVFCGFESFGFRNFRKFRGLVDLEIGLL
jgi:hypothetical protein